MRGATATDDAATLAAIGAAVAVGAATAHEALGHGVACLAGQGTVTLLTFLVFRCDGAGAVTDGAGPIGVLLVAAACLATLHRRAPRPSVAGLFAFALGVQAMLWFFAQMASEAIDGGDDWGHVARDLAWPGWWHPLLLGIAVTGYAATMRLAVALGRPLAAGRARRLLIPYGTAAAIAVVLGAGWHRDRIGPAIDALLSFGVAPLGYLVAIRVIARAPATGPAIDRHRGFVAIVAAIVAIFALTIARGVGRLA